MKKTILSITTISVVLLSPLTSVFAADALPIFWGALDAVTLDVTNIVKDTLSPLKIKQKYSELIFKRKEETLSLFEYIRQGRALYKKQTNKADKQTIINTLFTSTVNYCEEGKIIEKNLEALKIAFNSKIATQNTSEYLDLFIFKVDNPYAKITDTVPNFFRLQDCNSYAKKLLNSALR